MILNAKFSRTKGNLGRKVFTIRCSLFSWYVFISYMNWSETFFDKFFGIYPKLKPLPLSTNTSEEVSCKIRVITKVVSSGKSLLSYLGSAGLDPDVRNPQLCRTQNLSTQSTWMPVSVPEEWKLRVGDWSLQSSRVPQTAKVQHGEIWPEHLGDCRPHYTFT